MLCHRIGKEEEARTPLDIDALQGIGIYNIKFTSADDTYRRRGV